MLVPAGADWPVQGRADRLVLDRADSAKDMAKGAAVRPVGSSTVSAQSELAVLRPAFLMGTALRDSET